MAYRNIFIANTAGLSTKNEQLIVDNGEVFSFPIEDIRCVLVEDCRTTLTAALLSRFAEYGVPVIICNEKHLPSAELNPINSYSRQLKQIKNQIAASGPFKKRIWQQIVSAKISNQARCLELSEKSGAKQLFVYAQNVRSGDPENVEGRAAAFYFRSLFGQDFRRDEETTLNAALDYGYAIIRAIICRTICIYGFEPSLGIHHCSELNNFNLADDIIEPFRPFIDLYIVKNHLAAEEFGTKEKAALLRSLNAVIEIKGKKYNITNAIELMVQSYADCLKTNKTEIVLPVLTDVIYQENE